MTFSPWAPGCTTIVLPKPIMTAIWSTTRCGIRNDIEAILHRIPEDGLHVHGRATSRVLSFSIGRFALSMGSEAGSWAQADKDLFSLALQGNQVGRTYLLQQTNGEASAIGLIGLSYGHPLRVTFADAFAVGATLQMVYGIRQARIVDAQASFLTQPHGFAVNGEYEAALDVGKPGVNLDAGVAAQFGNHWTISAALLNLTGHTVWTTEESSFGYVRGDSLTAYKAADLEEEAIEDSSWTVENGDNFQQKMPARLRIGGAYETDKVAVTLDYIQGFSRTAWHGTHAPVFFRRGMENRTLVAAARGSGSGRRHRSRHQLRPGHSTRRIYPRFGV